MNIYRHIKIAGKMGRFLTGLFLFFAASPLHAQEVTPMTLQQCIDFATTHQSAIKDAVLDQSIARQKVRETNGSSLPQLNGSFDMQDVVKRQVSLLPGEFFGGPKGSYIPVSFGTQYNATAGISASQLIFDGSYVVARKAAKVYMDLAQKNVTRTKIESIDAITKAYYMVVINNEHFKLLETNVKRLEKIYNDTKAYNEQGFVEKLDVDRLSVSLTNLKVQQEQVGKQLEIGECLLKFQMGMPMDSKIKLMDTLTYVALAGSADEKVAYDKRIEYSLLQSQKRFSELTIQGNQFSYMPSLAAYGALNTSAMRTKFDFFDTEKRWFAFGVIGIKLTVPIFDGFQRDARIQQAKFGLQKIQNDEANLKNLIDFQVKSAWISYENSFKTLESQKKNLELAKEVARLTQIKYKEGVGSNLEVVTAESDLRTAQTNYFDALYNTIITRLDYQKAKGAL